MACGLLLLDTLDLIIYDSAVVHIQYLSLISITHTNRQCTRIVFPTISRILTQRLETTSAWIYHGPTQRYHTTPCNDDETPTLTETTLTQIQKCTPAARNRYPTNTLLPLTKQCTLKLSLNNSDRLSTGNTMSDHNRV